MYASSYRSRRNNMNNIGFVNNNVIGLLFWEDVGGLEKGRWGSKQRSSQFTWLSGSSWGEVQPGYWAVHHPGRW